MPASRSIEAPVPRDSPRNAVLGKVSCSSITPCWGYCSAPFFPTMENAFSVLTERNAVIVRFAAGTVIKCTSGAAMTVPKTDPACAPLHKTCPWMASQAWGGGGKSRIIRLFVRVYSLFWNSYCQNCSIERWCLQQAPHSNHRLCCVTCHARCVDVAFFLLLSASIQLRPSCHAHIIS